MDNGFNRISSHGTNRATTPLPMDIDGAGVVVEGADSSGVRTLGVNNMHSGFSAFQNKGSKVLYTALLDALLGKWLWLRGMGLICFIFTRVMFFYLES